MVLFEAGVTASHAVVAIPLVDDLPCHVLPQALVPYASMDLDEN
jgi:hypothetical protein